MAPDASLMAAVASPLRMLPVQLGSVRCRRPGRRWSTTGDRDDRALVVGRHVSERSLRIQLGGLLARHEPKPSAMIDHGIASANHRGRRGRRYAAQWEPVVAPSADDADNVTATSCAESHHWMRARRCRTSDHRPRLYGSSLNDSAPSRGPELAGRGSDWWCIVLIRARGYGANVGRSGNVSRVYPETSIRVRTHSARPDRWSFPIGNSHGR